MRREAHFSTGVYFYDGESRGSRAISSCEHAWTNTTLPLYVSHVSRSSASCCNHGHFLFHRLESSSIMRALLVRFTLTEDIFSHTRRFKETLFEFRSPIYPSTISILLVQLLDPFSPFISFPNASLLTYVKSRETYCDNVARVPLRRGFAGDFAVGLPHHAVPRKNFVP